MTIRVTKALLVLGSPVYLLVLGPAGLLGVPVVTALLGPSIWPALSRGRLLLLGTATVATMGAVYMVAVFVFYGLAGPTGAWLWAGPVTGLLVYLGGWRFVLRRPWLWPLVITIALLAVGAVGAIAMVTGVRFEA